MQLYDISASKWAYYHRFFLWRVWALVFPVVVVVFYLWFFAEMAFDHRYNATFGFIVFLFATGITALSYVILQRSYFDIKDDHLTTCPVCQGTFKVSIPWKCSCGHGNGVHNQLSIASLWEGEQPHIFHKCKACGLIPPAVSCNSCGAILKLSERPDDIAIRQCAVPALHSPDRPPPPDPQEEREAFLSSMTRLRYQHHHIIAAPGHGKTQALQYLIARDLEDVEQGKASIVVLDSQRAMIDTIKRLKVFAPHEPLHGRLVVIDPTDVQFPISLPLFQQKQQADSAEAERLHSASISLLSYVFSGLLGTQLTPYQNTIMGYAFRLCMAVPDSTIFTLRQVLKDVTPFQSHLPKLDPLTRDFFETEYHGTRYKGAREEVQSKLFGIFNNVAFTRMFANPVPTFDMFSELNAGKVILIDTAKDHLHEGASLFGRFFIAMVQQAAHERLNKPKLPTYFYIDEAQEYFDENIAGMLAQARKTRIGIVLAHQFLGQLKEIHEAVLSIPAIKFAGGLSPDDATKMAKAMNTTPDFIRGQKPLSFAAQVQGSRAVSLSIPLKHMESMEQMTDTEWTQVRAEIRAQYAARPPARSPAEPPSVPPTPSAPSRRPTFEAGFPEEIIDETAPTKW